MSRRVMIGLALLGACGPSLAELRPTAAARELQADAPVKAEASADIDAPVAAVWELLSGIEAWPKWNRDAPGAHLDGPLAPGTRFGYGSHNLELACVEPPHALAFLGTVAGYKGITVWELSEPAADKTHVTVRESNDGFLITVFYGAPQLEQHLKLWVDLLKQEAERRP